MSQTTNHPTVVLDEDAVERGARALYMADAVRTAYEVFTWEEISESYRDEWRAKARIVLDAIK